MPIHCEPVGRRALTNRCGFHRPLTPAALGCGPVIVIVVIVLAALGLTVIVAEVARRIGRRQDRYQKGPF